MKWQLLNQGHSHFGGSKGRPGGLQEGEASDRLHCPQSWGRRDSEALGSGNVHRVAGSWHLHHGVLSVRKHWHLAKAESSRWWAGVAIKKKL